MHLIGINLSYSLLNTAPHVHLGLKCFDKSCLVIFTVKKGIDFAIMAWRITNWAYLLKYELKDTLFH